jgi:hypothetical protein
LIPSFFPLFFFSSSSFSFCLSSPSISRPIKLCLHSQGHAVLRQRKDKTLKKTAWFCIRRGRW